MVQRFRAVLVLFLFLAAGAFGQGLNTTATKDDWEEINFEFNSAILSDGYPSLLRLADLLKAHPDYRVKIEGNADSVGSNRYNEKLALRRAEEVKRFLVKYGAAENQLSTSSSGKRNPKVDNRSKEGRFMNRRVALTVTDGQGRTVSAGGVGEAIQAMGGGGMSQKCCEDILKRLDRLDEIANMLRDLANANGALRSELDNLRKDQEALKNQVAGLPKPLSEDTTKKIVETETAAQIQKARDPRFSLLGLNAGVDSNGDLTFTGKGRFFAPFKENFAIQAQGEYLYFRNQKEGQFDLGLVNRINNFQGGLFTSFKHVYLSNLGRFDNGVFNRSILSGTNLANTNLASATLSPESAGGGTLGQAAVTLDYLFPLGRIGVFGTKGFLNNPVISRTALSTNVTMERYLSLIDQVGVSTTLGLVGRTYLEGNFGYLKSRGNADRPGGTLRFVFPISDRVAFTAEGGINETLLGRENNGRAVFGVQFGNFIRPKEFRGLSHPVPVDVPRVRYEVLTRMVRTGNSPPVADAGPDQLGVSAGTITLDGSGSYDPDGDPITYRWTQVAGPTVSISGQSNAKASFTAEDGQTYAFRLIVTDDRGAQGTARTTVTTTRQQAVQIVRFQASPQVIQPGQASTIDWQVLNADQITISPEIGSVGANGSREVRPNQTTRYTITASNKVSQATATTTIQVNPNPDPRFTSCQVTPTNITVGESATIIYSTENATSVSIDPGIGSVPNSGTRVVTPTQSTTYRLTATGATGTTAANCQLTVAVGPGAGPRIIRFTAAPSTIVNGNATTLFWVVENATEVNITGIGSVGLNGTQEVRPTADTTYTITAKNQFGQATANTSVTVTPANNGGGGGDNPGPKVSLTQCQAQPAGPVDSGTAVSLLFGVQNATSISISGVGTVPGSPVVVRPTQSTTYTITAQGPGGPATCAITVNVNAAPPPPPPPPTPPTIIIAGGPVITTIYRLLTLDASGSFDPDNGQLIFRWESLNTRAAILDPNSPTPRVQLGELFGDYEFRLTVTNQKGVSASQVVTVRYAKTGAGQ